MDKITFSLHPFKCRIQKQFLALRNSEFVDESIKETPRKAL